MKRILMIITIVITAVSCSDLQPSSVALAVYFSFENEDDYNNIPQSGGTYNIKSSTVPYNYNPEHVVYKDSLLYVESFLGYRVCDISYEEAVELSQQMSAVDDSLMPDFEVIKEENFKVINSFIGTRADITGDSYPIMHPYYIIENGVQIPDPLYPDSLLLPHNSDASANFANTHFLYREIATVQENEFFKIEVVRDDRYVLKDKYYLTIKPNTQGKDIRVHIDFLSAPHGLLYYQSGS